MVYQAEGGITGTGFDSLLLERLSADYWSIYRFKKKK